MEKSKYLVAKARNIVYAVARKIIGHRRFKRKKYYGKSILDIDSANRLIGDLIQSNKPFLVARFGDAELRTLVYYLENEMALRKGFPAYIKKVMHMNAGFFPATDGHLAAFGQTLKAACAKVDVFGVWFNLLEDYVIHTYDRHAALVALEAIEPYRSVSPWSQFLEGKRVLVIHPFAESIQKQYAIRDKLFEDRHVLPDFKLLTYQAVQTNAGGQCGFSDWFEASDSMFRDICRMDFDIAIVGCGSYGLPLAARIKDLGKQVIHMAGATQILFGIRGARWDVRPEMQKYFNEYWTRPLDSERPKDAKSVEGGCYW